MDDGQTLVSQKVYCKNIIQTLSMECRRKYLKSRIYVRAFVNDSKISNIISSAFLIQIDDGQPLMSRKVYCKNTIQALSMECRRKYVASVYACFCERRFLKFLISVCTFNTDGWWPTSVIAKSVQKYHPSIVDGI